MLKNFEASLACEKDAGSGGSVLIFVREVKGFPVPPVYLELGKGRRHGWNLGAIPGR